MSKSLRNFVGIDISKNWFDAALIKADDSSRIIHQQFVQKPEGFKKMQQWLGQQGVCLNAETLFCMEYTGLYNTGLVKYLVEEKAHFW